jgi:fucose 4-O-acetylase-like acetyltransferase
MSASSSVIREASELCRTGDVSDVNHRIEWVDTCKGLGMLLVFYGHALQELARAGLSHAHVPFQLIYAFHMPLFFMVAGFFFKPADQIGHRISGLALRRLLPMAFFGLMLLPLWAYGPLRHGMPLWPQIEPELVGYTHGLPELNWVTWFLVCLFVCECMALICLPRITSVGASLLFGALCILLGTQLCAHSAAMTAVIGLDGHSWFLSEAIVALGFYAIGHALYPLLRKMASSPVLASPVFVAAAALTLSTFSLNSPDTKFVVMMSASQHGNAIAFTVTALAGCLAMFSLSMVLARFSALRSIGRDSLIWLGLNGIFFHFVNPEFAKLMPPANTVSAISVYALMLATGSLLVCWPLASLLRRYLPQLVGYPRTHGPLLPALETATTAH